MGGSLETRTDATIEVTTGRFGKITVRESDVIQIPQGLMGLPDLKRFALIDAGDETLILWMQSLDQPALCVPVLEPKIFKADYVVRLSAAELRELKMEGLGDAAVYSILTIPQDVSQMSANLKAPLVINLKEKIARQVVLQENDYNVKHPMFRELRAHLMTIQSQKGRTSDQSASSDKPAAVAIGTLPRSESVRPLYVG